MLKQPKIKSGILEVLVVCLFLDVNIIFALDEQNVGATTAPMNVCVAEELFDVRSLEEKEEVELTKEIYKEIPRMLINKIDSRKIFGNVTSTSLALKRPSNEKLDSLRAKGVDAVIVANIIYSETSHNLNIGRMMLYSVPLGLLSAYIFNFTVEGSYVVYWYGPGVALGVYLESLHKEYATELVVKVISTYTYDTIQESDYKIQLKKLTDTKEFNMKTKSINNVIKEMVDNISKVSISSEQ